MSVTNARTGNAGGYSLFVQGGKLHYVHNYVGAEEYHIEAAYSWWNANPDLFVNSEALDIIGSDIDLINDLGIEQQRLGKFDLVLKPAKKHRLKYQHLPIKNERDAYRVTREFIFNGQRYTIGLPVIELLNT